MRRKVNDEGELKGLEEEEELKGLEEVREWRGGSGEKHRVGVAVGLGVVIPGAGQLYNYQLRKAFLSALLFYPFFLLFLNYFSYRLLSYLYSFLPPSPLPSFNLSWTFPPPPLLSWLVGTVGYLLYSDFFLVWGPLWVVGLYCWLIFDARKEAKDIRRRGWTKTRKEQLGEIMVEGLTYVPISAVEFLGYLLRHGKEESDRLRYQRAGLTASQWFSLIFRILRLSIEEFGRSYVYSILLQLAIFCFIIFYFLVYFVQVVLFYY